MERRRARVSALRVGAAGGCIAVGFLAVAASVGEDAKAPAILPNIDQAPPAQLRVRSVDTPQGRAHRLGFTSRIANDGRGPLIIKSTRTGNEVMRADQVMKVRGGGLRTRRGVGSVRYVRRGSHEHWHLMGLQRFELRTPAGRRLPLRVAKQGLCLGDREPAREDIRTLDAYNGECGKRRPDLLKLTQGLSPEWTDPYFPNVEGQELDITGLRSGRYVLVHRADPFRRLAESNESDNAASVAISIRRARAGATPRVKILRKCRARARC